MLHNYVIETVYCDREGFVYYYMCIFSKVDTEISIPWKNMENLEFLRIFFFYLKEETLLKLGGNFSEILSLMMHLYQQSLPISKVTNYVFKLYYYIYLCFYIQMS